MKWREHREKLAWIIVGAVVGAVVSLLLSGIYNRFVAAEPELEVSAEPADNGIDLTVENIGRGDASAVTFTASVYPVFGSGLDIVEVEPVGDIRYADCETRLEQRNWGAAIPDTVSTLVARCPRFGAGVTWSARLVYDAPSDSVITGALVQMTYDETNETHYAFLPGWGDR